MADNVTLNAGTGGDVIAADDIGGVKHQLVKMEFGAADTATPVSATNPLPVAANDCVSLLSTTISATGNGAAIDTLGYGAVVVQLSGEWSGNLYFEAGNDGSTWDAIFAFSRDALNLQDIITQNGLFTIRPSGRYMRIVTTALNGTITVNAIGRAAEGISAADILSLAMDRNNNAPMHVQLDDVSVAAIRPQAPLVPLAFFDVTGAVAINTAIPGSGIDISGYRGFSVQYSVGTSGTAHLQVSNDGTTWVNLALYNPAGNPITTGMTAGAGLLMTNACARYMRIQMTTAATGGTTRFVLLGSQRAITQFPATQTVSGTVTANIGTGALAAGTNAIGDVGIQFRANATGAATINHVVSAASTNTASVKAAAGRVVGWSFVNTTASYQYVKLHNTASAPTAGSGVVMTIAIPPNGVNNMPVGGGGIGFSTGIGRSIVTGSADTDATATTAGAVVGDLFYA